MAVVRIKRRQHQRQTQRGGNSPAGDIKHMLQPRHQGFLRIQNTQVRFVVEAEFMLNKLFKWVTAVRIQPYLGKVIAYPTVKTGTNFLEILVLGACLTGADAFGIARP